LIWLIDAFWLVKGQDSSSVKHAASSHQDST
jgi:hypothetical protein